MIHCMNELTVPSYQGIRVCCLEFGFCHNCPARVIDHDFKTGKCLYGTKTLDLISPNTLTEPETPKLLEIMKRVPKRPKDYHG